MEWWQILLIVLGGVALLFVLSIIFYKPFFKRFWDIFLSLLALTVFSPLFLILMIIGAIAMRGNPFFAQKRPGKRNRHGKEKIFYLIKFRTMSNAKDENGNLLPDEKRLNKYGKFLRSTSLDEFPEAFNILFGDMSVVGPRPLLIEYLPWYTDKEKHRHDVKPGLTGWAQINGRNNLAWDQRFEYDVYYVYHYSIFFDLKIIFITIGRMFKRDDVQIDTEKQEGNMANIRKERHQKDNNVESI